MQWGHLTSLASLGVGLNLGLTLIESVRKALDLRLELRLQTFKVQVKALLGEAYPLVECEADQIFERYRGAVRTINVTFTAAALAAAVGLFALLVYAALNNDGSAPNYSAVIVAAAAGGPILV